LLLSIENCPGRRCPLAMHAPILLKVFEGKRIQTPNTKSQTRIA